MQQLRHTLRGNSQCRADVAHRQTYSSELADRLSSSLGGCFGDAVSFAAKLPGPAYVFACWIGKNRLDNHLEGVRRNIQNQGHETAHRALDLVQTLRLGHPAVQLGDSDLPPLVHP